MTATELFTRCRALGVTLTRGRAGTLEWEADADPPGELLDALTANKTDVLALLAPPLARDADTALWIADGIAADLGLPAGSLTLHPLPDVCPGCAFCRPRELILANTRSSE